MADELRPGITAGACIGQVAVEWKVDHIRRFGSYSYGRDTYFTTFVEAGHRWKLSLSVEPCNTFRVHLSQLDDQLDQRNIKIRLSLLESNRETLDCCKGEPMKSAVIMRNTRSFEMSFVCYAQDGFPYDRIIIVRCEFAADGGIYQGVKVDDINDDMLVGLKEGRHSDISLVVGERVFPAHKFVLAARSPMFRAMLEQPMKETQLNRIEINDVSADVIETILEYMYSGRIRDKKRASLELLAATDKYQLLDLKDMCTTIIGSAIRVDNACQILEAAYLHNAAQLMNDVMEFIKCHGDIIHLTAEFIQLGKKHVDLLAEVCQMLLSEPRRFHDQNCY